jgi:CRISPR-associated protein Cmr5
MPGQKTLNQERAEFALKKVKNIKDSKNIEASVKDKYASNVKRLPALIITNGLIPTLAFLKSKEEIKPLYDTMNEWLKEKGFSNNNDDDALEYLLTCDFSILRLATMEAIAFANWLKRMVEIEKI